MKRKVNKPDARNKFVFLYPQQEIFEYELEIGSHFIDSVWWRKMKSHFQPRLARAKTEAEKATVQAEARKSRVEFFRPNYKQILNRCISRRYRQNGFQIFYALLDNEPLADMIVRKPEDRIIFVGMDAKTHRTKREDGTYAYPSQNYILDQVLPIGQLVIGGFHMWDCVDKLAKTAHDRGISVLVDEDLTEFLPARMAYKGFKTDTYPSYDPRTQGENIFRMFMKAREKRPWLWQKY